MERWGASASRRAGAAVRSAASEVKAGADEVAAAIDAGCDDGAGEVGEAEDLLRALEGGVGALGDEPLAGEGARVDAPLAME